MFGFGSARPTAREVAVRALILRQVVVHALATPTPTILREASSSWSREDRRQFEDKSERTKRELLATLERFRSKISPKERAYFRSTVFTMTERQHLDANWRIEALQALRWCLSLIEMMPPYDVEALPEWMKGFPPSTADHFVGSASLRPGSEIDRARDLAELWHWRSRTRQLIEEGGAFHQIGQFTSYDDIVRATAVRAHANGELLDLTDGDFTAFGKAYRDLDDDEWSRLRSITVERHFALNWVCGRAKSSKWDDTPTDT